MVASKRQTAAMQAGIDAAVGHRDRGHGHLEGAADVSLQGRGLLAFANAPAHEPDRECFEANPESHHEKNESPTLQSAFVESVQDQIESPDDQNRGERPEENNRAPLFVDQRLMSEFALEPDVVEECLGPRTINCMRHTREQHTHR